MKGYWRKSRKPRTERTKLKANQRLGIVYCLLATILVVGYGCSRNRKLAHTIEYVCPMHPTVVQEGPGVCPVCGMDLVLKGRTEENVKITDELRKPLKPVDATVVSTIETIHPVKKSMTMKAKANGLVIIDASRVTAISSRFNGRIEKLFAKNDFQPIYKGQKIYEIYSPEIVAAQKDLLYLTNSDNENSELIDGAKEKLRLSGLSDDQINELISTGSESNSLAVYSSQEGYITNWDEGLSKQSSSLQVREGSYVEAGQVIFKVVSAKNVWAEFDLPADDVAKVKVHDPIRIDIAGEELDEKVDFVQPFFKEGQPFSKVRVYLANHKGKIKIGQLISASFEKTSPELMWIPLSAQLNLGSKRIVFIKKEGMFQPSNVSTGSRSGPWIEVLNGINVTDCLAYNAQFLIDSESFIKTGGRETKVESQR